MKRLTAKEEEIMQMFWEHGPMFVRELLAFYEEPKPEYKRSALNDVVAQYYNNSYTNVVSAFIEEEGMSVDELKALIAEIESKKSSR